MVGFLLWKPQVLVQPIVFVAGVCRALGSTSPVSSDSSVQRQLAFYPRSDADSMQRHCRTVYPFVDFPDVSANAAASSDRFSRTSPFGGHNIDAAMDRVISTTTTERVSHTGKWT